MPLNLPSRGSVNSFVSCGVESSGELMLIPLSYYPLCGASYTADAYVPGQTEFPSKSGNVLSWAGHLASYGSFNPAAGRFEKTEQARLFERLRDILQQMKGGKARQPPESAAP